MRGKSLTGGHGRRIARAFMALSACLPLAFAHGQPGARFDAAEARAASLHDLLDCRLWLSALDDCPRLPVQQRPELTVHPVPEPPGAADGQDWDGIKRDTYYFLGLQLAIIGVLYVMPESVSSWSDEQKSQHRLNKWWNNVTSPTWDDDDDYINYVLHPYWGAAYYVRARERGYGARQAFWYSYLLSTLYETGVEALFEPVSIQDFFVTPIVGSWLGGYFMNWRRATQERVATTGTRRWRDNALLIATDPLGNAADFVDRRLGRRAEFTARPFLVTDSAISSDPLMPRSRAALNETYGVRLTVRW